MPGEQRQVLAEPDEPRPARHVRVEGEREERDPGPDERARAHESEHATPGAPAAEPGQEERPDRAERDQPPAERRSPGGVRPMAMSRRRRAVARAAAARAP